MDTQPMTALAIEAFALSSSTAPDERRQRVLDDCAEHAPKPETRRRATLRWLIDSLALAGAGMTGAYVGVWLDPRADWLNETKRNDETPPRR